MNAIKDQVAKLVDVELAAANEKFPQFHSGHEGWAVIQEEIEECGDELSEVYIVQKDMWDNIKNNRRIKFNISFMYDHAIKLACEAIQVAAMCKKFLAMEGRSLE